jgi:flagellar hook-associated protein 3 FlgL
MRVNPNPMSDLLAAVEQTQQQINTDLLQISSGESVNLPSDDPAAAALLVQNANQTSETDQYLRSISSVQGEMQTADSALSSVVTALQRAISLGVEGANGTLNASDREAVAVEVQGIQSQLMQLANLSYQGSYVFAGTATQTPPYVPDSKSASGVSYVGNTEANSIQVGDSFNLQTNLPGSQLFSSSGTDMFQSIQDLVTSLQSGTGISAAVTEVSSAYDSINSQRVFYGNAINQLDSQQTELNSDSTQLAAQQNTLGAADLPKDITNLESAQTSNEAALQAIAQTQQTNLFSYLK